MGTNYYVRWGGCEHCGKGGNELHVGKSSSGFHGYLEGDPRLPEWWDGSWLATKEEWGRFATTALRNGAVLADEYGADGFGPNEFLSRIGKGERQAKAYRERYYPGGPEIAWFWEIHDLTKLRPYHETPDRERLFWVAVWGIHDLTKLRPYHETPDRERLFWVADGYTFSTGEWS